MLISEMFIKPRRIKITDLQDIDYYVSMCNGKKDLYQSVYLYEDDIDVNNAIVDKIFLDFDFDMDMKFLQNTRIVAQYLFENDYSFYIRFSGNGFHIFILLDDYKIKNPKIAIKNYVNFLHKKTKTESDPAVVGDLRRVVRIVNTLNLKHKKKQSYCIPITFNELMNNTYEDIRLLAQNPRGDDFINGHRLLNIAEWDKQVFLKKQREHISVHTNKISNDIPPCIQSMMKDPMLGNAGRVQFILFFRDLGYTKEEVEDILYSFLSEEKFHHCVYEEHLIDYLFEKEDYIFHDCFIQKDNGFCTSDTCEGHKLYY